MKLTADVIQKARTFYNPLKERELDLRGLRLAAIENMGSAKDQFDTIDFSDNAITKLENLPKFPRLGTLLFSNNIISEIDERIINNIPNLHSLICINIFYSILIVTNNKISNLSEINKLRNLNRLSDLSLVDNPCMLQTHSRSYIIYVLPQLTVLNFQKITQRERKTAEELYKDKLDKDSKTFTPTDPTAK